MQPMMTALKAVLAGFFGVRSRKNAEQASPKLLYLLLAALLCAMLLGLLVFALARYLVMNGGGA
jgi:hypothetical protein